MKPTSAKAKGRDGQKEVAEILNNWYGWSNQECIPTPNSVSGVDLWLSNSALEKFPYSVEVKRVQNLNIWSALKQAETNAQPNTRPLLIFRRNNGKWYAAIELHDFLLPAHRRRE